MKTLLISAAAVAVAAIFTPTPSSAQIGIGVPGFGVQIGGGPYYGGYGYGPSYGGYGYGGGYGPYYGGGYGSHYGGGYGSHYGGYRAYDYDEPVVVQRRVYSGYDEPVVRRRVYRQRSVSMSGCRTMTVQRADGSVRRIRRCG
jgi:hypothetical protein